jgi:hypothetical protein
LLRHLYRAISRRSYNQLSAPNQSWVLRTLFAGAKNSALVKLFMILPPPMAAKPTTTKFCAWITALSWLKDRSHVVQKMVGYSKGNL